MIKYFFTLLFITVLSVSLLSAQESSNDKKFRFGLKLAPATMWYKAGTSEVSSGGTNIGFAYGLMADYLFAENYSISTGLEMLLMNAKYTYETPASGIVSAIKTDFKSNYQFVQIPVSIKMKSNEIGGIRYFGKFGFNNAICYKSTADISENGTIQKNKDISSNTNRFRFGLFIGGGAEYNISGSTNIIAGLHFDNGFLNMNSSNLNKIYSRGIVLDLGVVF